jgi:hypothetical protein
VVKPPASWDQEITDSFDMWLKQTTQPEFPLAASDKPAKSEGIVEKLGNIKDQFRSKFSGFGKRPSPKGARVSKIS